MWLSFGGKQPGWPVDECPARAPAVFWASVQDQSPPAHSCTRLPAWPLAPSGSGAGRRILKGRTYFLETRCGLEAKC